MAAQTSVTSSLNPNAPLFIPASFQILTDFPPEWDVEDFSPEWWNLVQTSPEFCEFWMREYDGSDVEDLFMFLEMDDVFLATDLNTEVDESTDGELA